jgi:hypothetical protein
VKARLLLAEASTTHPDGTISMLRAGITNVWGETPPVNLQASLVTRIEAEMGDVGQHEIEIMCMDEDGKEVMPKLNGQFAVGRGGGHNNILLNFGFAFPRFGLFTFVVRIDHVQYDTWSLRVSASPPGAGQQPQSGPPAAPPAGPEDQVH